MLCIFWRNELKYEVLWIDFWKNQSKIAILSVTIMSVGHFAYEYYKKGTITVYDSLSDAFITISFLMSCLVAFIFVIAYWARTWWAIEITHEKLIGRDFWGRKKEIELSKISRLKTFYNAAGKFQIADAGKQGKVYISEYIKNFDEVISIIEGYISDKNA